MHHSCVSNLLHCRLVGTPSLTLHSLASEWTTSIPWSIQSDNYPCIIEDCPLDGTWIIIIIIIIGHPVSVSIIIKLIRRWISKDGILSQPFYWRDTHETPATLPPTSPTIRTRNSQEPCELTCLGIRKPHVHNCSNYRMCKYCPDNHSDKWHAFRLNYPPL